MQIFNDKKKRIGTLSGFKDREITTTLDSGDKELSFSYPVAGALVDLLKEEYYIRWYDYSISFIEVVLPQDSRQRPCICGIQEI